MDSTFGQDICTLALEILTEITAYMIKNPHLQNPVITENIQNMIRVCLHPFKVKNNILTANI